MEELGIQMKREEPTFEDAVAEKTAIHQEIQQEEDTFLRFKKLQQHLEFLSTMEDYVVGVPLFQPGAAKTVLG